MESCDGGEYAYVEVLGVNLVVLWEVEVLLGDTDTLAEDVLVNELAVGLWNEPVGRVVSMELFEVASE